MKEENLFAYKAPVCRGGNEEEINWRFNVLNRTDFSAFPIKLTNFSYDEKNQELKLEVQKANGKTFLSTLYSQGAILNFLTDMGIDSFKDLEGLMEKNRVEKRDTALEGFFDSNGNLGWISAYSNMPKEVSDEEAVDLVMSGKKNYFNQGTRPTRRTNAYHTDLKIGITKILDFSDLFWDKKVTSPELKIKKACFDPDEGILAFELIEGKKECIYSIFGQNAIRTFLADMQVLESSDFGGGIRRDIEKLAGKTLDCYFHRAQGILALRPRGHKGELPSEDFEKLEALWEERNKEYRRLSKGMVDLKESDDRKLENFTKPD